MTKKVLDQEMVDETHKIVALAYSRRYATAWDVGFVLAFRYPGMPAGIYPDSDRPDKWFYQVLVLAARSKPRRYLPAAARLYRRIKKRDDVIAGLTFRDCAM